MSVYKSAVELVGNTPLVEANHFVKENNLKAKVLVKLEYFNPAGSVKDRIAKAIIEDAEERGVLKEGSVIIEPTSGNTGIGLSSIAAVKGYRIIISMPETMSVERRNLMKAYGAELVLTDGAKGMKGAIEKAEELAAEIPNSFIAGQFTNPVNPAAHKATTGPEIWEDTEGKVDIFVAGVGTGFVPDTLDTSIYDEIITVDNEDAFKAGRAFAKQEGVLVGISSGAALQAAKVLAKRPENEGKIIVALLPDTGDRYLSTPLFAE